MKRAELILLSHFLEDYSEKLGSAGCNDMSQDVFAGIEPAREYDLIEDFNAWDRLANPEGWEPRRREHIPDFLWVSFLKSRVRREIIE